MNELSTSILVSLATGIVSGLLSGCIVTNYFRKVDKEKEEKENRSKQFDKFTKYISKLISEAELAEKTGDYNNLQRLIARRTDYTLEVYSVLGEFAADSFRSIENKLHTIEQGVKNNSLDVKEIRAGLISIFPNMLGIISLSMSESCNK